MNYFSDDNRSLFFSKIFDGTDIDEATTAFDSIVQHLGEVEAETGKKVRFINPGCTTCEILLIPERTDEDNLREVQAELQTIINGALDLDSLAHVEDLLKDAKVLMQNIKRKHTPTHVPEPRIPTYRYEFTVVSTDASFLFPGSSTAKLIPGEQTVIHCSSRDQAIRDMIRVWFQPRRCYYLKSGEDEIAVHEDQTGNRMIINKPALARIKVEGRAVTYGLNDTECVQRMM